MKKTNSEPPIGIIRTLPAIYADPASDACKNYRDAINAMTVDQEEHWFLALPSRPRHEPLYVYIVIGNKIDARFTFAGYRDGGKEVRLWDGEIRAPKCWAICGGPAVKPPWIIRKQGFRGFHYTTEPLW